MADSLTIDVDARDLLRRLNVLGDRAFPALNVAAKQTADIIQANARARLNSQTAGTGKTAEAITVDEIRGGYRVFVAPVPQRADNVPLWLEQGTQRMRPRPFLLASARLEEGPHLRRVSEALDDLLVGVGD